MLLNDANPIQPAKQQHPKPRQLGPCLTDTSGKLFDSPLKEEPLKKDP